MMERRRKAMEPKLIEPSSVPIKKRDNVPVVEVTTKGQKVPKEKLK